MLKDTRYFTVFGGSYVPEHRQNDYRETRRQGRRSNLVASWVVCWTLVTGISVLAIELSRFTAGGSPLF